MNSPTYVAADAHLAEALQGLAKLPQREGDRISWESNKLERGTFEVIYSLRFRPPIDDHIKDGAVWHVLNECARQNDFSSKFFLHKLREFLKTHSNKEQKWVSVVGQFNTKAAADFPSCIATPMGVIKFRAFLTRIHRDAIASIDDYERKRLGFHNDFMYMTIRFMSADDHAANNFGYRTFKYALGVLNLHSYGFGVSHRFGYPNAPLGTFLSASTFCLVDEVSRKLGGFMSDNPYPINWKSSFTVSSKSRLSDVEKFSKNLTKAIGRLDFSDRVIQAIVLFQEGLEATHIDIALLRFWTGIELLCSSDECEVSERIIERACSIFIDRKHTAMRLSFIQEFRNKVVHRGDVGDHALLCAQWGSIYLSELIRFCAFNRLKIHTRDTLMKYLSSPTDEERLSETISIYRKRRQSLKRR